MDCLACALTASLSRLKALSMEPVSLVEVSWLSKRRWIVLRNGEVRVRLLASCAARKSAGRGCILVVL